jgi:7-cyano-7-deazaguanine reductase
MNTQDINSIASVHLGKAGDGTVVKPYVTPESVDKSLLVGIPRELNRTSYGINNDLFAGMDVWNAYEFSTLLKNGFPVSGWLKFVYDWDTPNIVESKSVKLYLNSFNMARLINSLDEIYRIEDMIAVDLGEVLGCNDVMVNLSIGDVGTYRPIKHDFIQLETYCDVENMTFDQYNEDVNILKVVDSDRKPQQWKSYSLRSNCRVTNQPDWGDVYVAIKGPKGVTPESLLQYIVSMRRENHFHEEICECIYKRLFDILQPDDLFVTCLYTRRGGIDINPVRASHYHVMHKFADALVSSWPCTKTSRQ